ncbi:MAG: EAL domain-containing protein [Treponema sp.]|nr:EAL domain-containing protein [Treponema sp.]
MPSTIISFNLCALIIAASFLIIFLIRQPLMIFQDKVYLNIVIATVIIDFGSALDASGLLRSATEHFILRNIIVALLFYTMLLWPLYFAALFNFKLSLGKLKPIIIVSAVAVSALLVINFFTRAFFYIDPSLKYTETNIFQIAYSVALGISFITATSFFIPARVYASVENTFIYIFVLLSCITALVLENIFKSEEIFPLAISISIVSIYFTMPAPESFIDRMTGLFNEEGFNKLCAKKISGGKKTYCIAVCLHDARVVTAFGQRDRTALVKEIKTRAFGNLLKNSIIFKFYPGSYLIVLDKEDENFANKVLERAHEIFTNFRTGPGKTVQTPATVTLICCPDQASSTDEIKAYMMHILDKGMAENLSLVKSQDLPVENIHFLFKTQKLLSNAEKEGRLKVLYQPIYSLKTKSYDTAEALLRMTDENGEVISPSVFIPLSERNGSILELENFMMNEVCRTFSERHLGSYGLQTIGINLSFVECIQDNLRETVNGILKRYSLPHSCISVEITETAAGQASDSFNANILALSQDGYSICLDNLGTGNTSLKKLMSIPFNSIKIDKSIVIPAFSGSSEKAKVLFESILDITRISKAKVVIQGVETAVSAEAVAKLDADYIQGYYYSNPLEEDEFEEFLKKNRLPGSI